MSLVGYRSLGALVLVGALACEVATRSPAKPSATDSKERGPGAAINRDAIDPSAEIGVIVPRLIVQLHAPRSGILRGGGVGPFAAGELVYAIEASDDAALLEVHAAEVEEATATRERYAAELLGRARELRSAEQLGDHLAGHERDAARDAHSTSTRELHRAVAARKAAAARLEAQRARVHAGQLDAPFSGRVIQALALPSAWVDAGQALARFASTEDLVLRVGLPAERSQPSAIEVRWCWPERPDEQHTAVLVPARDEVDELSGLRLYEARIDARQLAGRPLGDSVRVQLPNQRDEPHHEHERP